VIVRIVRNVEDAGEHSRLHIHSVDDLMIFIGDNDDLTGLTVEVLFKRRVLFF